MFIAFRFSAVAASLVLGIAVGWVLHTPKPATPAVVEVEPINWSRPITSVIDNESRMYQPYFLKVNGEVVLLSAPPTNANEIAVFNFGGGRVLISATRGP